MEPVVALIGNLSLGELALIAALAVLVFGRRLPTVVAQAVGQLHKMRRALEDLRRESGIDEELRRIDHTVQEVKRDARLPDPIRRPEEPRAARPSVTGHGPAPATTDDGGEPEPDRRGGGAAAEG